METKNELKILFWIIVIFLTAFFLPIESARFTTALEATMDLARWYAREHVILCLLPAFFIAGFISVFVSQASVLRYFGANAKKWLAYTVASVSGTILAVCSCTILPLFTSIYKRGAGLGPAIAFLYSGPAINILAIILTARVLGFEMGVARTLGAVLFSIVIGLIMAAIYRKEEKLKKEQQMNVVLQPEKRPIWQTMFHFFSLVLILVFANWGSPTEGDNLTLWHYLFHYKWAITVFFSVLLAFSLIYFQKIKWTWVLLAASATALSAFISFSLIENAKIAPLIPVVVAIAALSIITLFDKHDEDNKEWTLTSWDFAKQIMPLLGLGVLIAGFLLGSTHDGQSIQGIIPGEWISWLVGGNSLFANFSASFIGAFMYFATLTEIPILQGLMASGMGKGPALALLLAGPSLSMPNMLVIKSVLGTAKTTVFVVLVILLSSLAGLFYGSIF